MIENIDEPVAIAAVRWLSPDEGGRRSGPPTAPVYASTATFRTGDPIEDRPDWPASDPRTLSVLLQRLTHESAENESMKVDFLAREQALPYLREGACMVVLEGPKKVAEAVVTEVLTENDSNDAS